MYVTSFNPMQQSFAPIQPGWSSSMAIQQPISGSWMAQPAGYLPVSNMLAVPAMQTGMFGFPSGAMSYSFAPAPGWQMGATPTPPATGYGAFQAGAGLVQPRVELAETNTDIVVTAELPNIDVRNLNLTVTDDSLSISALAYAPGGTSSLHRSIALPTSIKAEQVTATYNNGILEARLPKSDVSVRRQIRVNPLS